MALLWWLQFHSSLFALLFGEMVRYSHERISSMIELEVKSVLPAVGCCCGEDG